MSNRYFFNVRVAVLIIAASVFVGATARLSFAQATLEYMSLQSETQSALQKTAGQISQSSPAPAGSQLTPVEEITDKPAKAPKASGNFFTEYLGKLTLVSVCAMVALGAFMWLLMNREI